MRVSPTGTPVQFARTACEQVASSTDVRENAQVDESIHCGESARGSAVSSIVVDASVQPFGSSRRCSWVAEDSGAGVWQWLVHDWDDEFCVSCNGEVGVNSRKALELDKSIPTSCLDCDPERLRKTLGTWTQPLHSSLYAAGLRSTTRLALDMTKDVALCVGDAQGKRLFVHGALSASSDLDPGDSSKTRFQSPRCERLHEALS